MNLLKSKMNLYIYPEATVDYWPQIKTVFAKSYNDAVEKVIKNYATQLGDDSILDFENYQDFCDYLNDEYTIALGDLIDSDTLSMDDL